MSASFQKLLKIVHKHKDDVNFTGINMRIAKIRLTSDVIALCNEYKFTIRGEHILF